MAAKNRAQRMARSIERQLRHKKRVARQPDGEPMGKHLKGFKGMKVLDVVCRCGGCNPKLLAANREG